MIQTFFSKRIYKNDLDAKTDKMLQQMITDYNKILHYSYNQLVLAKRHPTKEDKDSLYFNIRTKYPAVNPYLQNAATQEAKAAFKSQKELRSFNKENLFAQIKKVESKISKVSVQKQNYQGIKDKLKAGSPQPFKLKSTKYKVLDDGRIAVTSKKYINYYPCLYAFEYQYLKPKQKKLKGRLGRLIFKYNKLLDKYNKLNDKSYTPSVVFGSKKLLKQTQAIGECKKQRHEIRNKQIEFRHKRHRRFEVSGRSDSVDGNFVFRYNNHRLSFVVNRTTYDMGETIFPYGQEQIDNYYNNLKINLMNHNRKSNKPITFSLEDCFDYYIVKVSLDVDYDKVTNYSKSDGVIGVDCNLGFYSIADITEDGNLKETSDLHYNWFKQTTGQTTKNIEFVAKSIIEKAINSNKPIVIEDLHIKTKSKIKDYNDNKTKNFKRSMFAHDKMVKSILSSATKNGIEVFMVDPSYTSFISKKKYIPVYKRSVHQLAAYTIGRRGMSMNERLPQHYGYTSWSGWYSQSRTSKHTSK